MNPIPLRHKRRVYAWACGRCGKVGSGSSCGLGYDPAMVAEMVKANADNGKRYASRCCLCHDCEAVELVGETYGLCPTCQAKEDKRLANVGAEWAASATARDAHNTTAIAAAGGDPDAAARLLEAMQDMGEYHWCSEWSAYCDEELWRIVNSGVEHWGLRDVEQRDIDELRRLSEKAGGGGRGATRSTATPSCPWPSGWRGADRARPRCLTPRPRVARWAHEQQSRGPVGRPSHLPLR